MDDFLAQCYAGPPMALIRVGQWDTTPPMIRAVTLQAMLAQYLNMCYMSLMKDNDRYVTDMFAMHPDHGPVCIVHKIMGIGVSKVIPTLSAMEISGNDLDAKRATITAVVRACLANVDWEQLFNDHECGGDSTDKLRADWVAKGRPDDDGIFVLGS